MLSSNSHESKASQPGNAKSVAIEEPVDLMKPDDGIEASSEGGGTINDPGGTDNKPPRVEDFESFV